MNSVCRLFRQWSAARAVDIRKFSLTIKNFPDQLLSGKLYADDGTRTHTMLPPADFESAASANSATSAEIRF